MRVQERLAANVKALRKQKGLSQSELAEASGTSLFSIQAVESGRRWPSTSTLSGIASALGAEEDHLFAAEKEPVGAKIDDLMAQLQSMKQPQSVALFDPELQALFERSTKISPKYRKFLLDQIKMNLEIAEQKTARDAASEEEKKKA